MDKQEENIKLENKKQLEFKSLKDKVFWYHITSLERMAADVKR